MSRNGFGQVTLYLLVPESKSRDVLHVLDEHLTLPPTEQVLRKRLAMAANPPVPEQLSPAAFHCLQTVAELLIPQTAAERVPLPELLVAGRAKPLADGWRYADLPPDLTALRQGLAALDHWSQQQHGVAFTGLPADTQGAILKQVQSGAAPWPGILSKHWFEDLLADLTQLYVADPRTMLAMGYAGYSFGAGFTEEQTAGSYAR